MKDIYIVVPTLDPDVQIMSKFMDELCKNFKKILVINDGSRKEFNKFFSTLEKKGVEIFYHHKNFGKGRALKNAFNYLLNEHPKLKGCVTCDSDGQHSVKDIKKCAELLIDNPQKLIIGVRNFDDDKVPARSKFGNKITRTIFKSFIGLEITDTQTGLRGFSKELMQEFSDISGERYEFETNMLIACKERSIPILEYEIETIYINSNETSHFNPIKDSIKIYRLFTKSFLLAFSSYILDLILFIVLYNVLKIDSKILAATIIARYFSSIYNYYMNSKLKFKNASRKTLWKYYIITIIEMFISGCFVAFFHDLWHFNVLLIKIVVDLIIWIVNIYIQSNLIIKDGNDE